MDATNVIVVFLCAATVLFLVLIEIRSRRNTRAVEKGSRTQQTTAEKSAINNKAI